MEWDAQFTNFVREHSDALYRSAWLLLGDRANASDLVQETLVRLYPKWDKVLSAEAPIACVRRTMTNRFLSDRRRRSTRDIVLAEIPESAVVDGHEASTVERAVLANRLARLPPRQRAAIVLRFYDDLPERDAAAVLGCPRLTLRSHVRRGLATLRAQLIEEEPSPRHTKVRRSS